MPVTSVFERLTLAHQMTVVLLEASEPLSIESVSDALKTRGIVWPDGCAGLERAWRHTLPIRQRQDGRLEVVRSGIEYANVKRHLRHTMGIDIDPEGHAPVNTGLPSEWYSASPHAELPLAAAGSEAPVTRD